MRYAHLLLLLACAMVWLVPLVMRDSQAPLPFSASYSDAAASRDGSANPFLFILSLIPFSTLHAFLIMSVICGILGGIGVWLLLRLINTDIILQSLALVLYSLSVLHVVAEPTAIGCAALLVPLAVGLSAGRYWVMGVVLSSLLALGGPVETFFAAVVPALTLLLFRKPLRSVIALAVPGVVGALVWGAELGKSVVIPHIAPGWVFSQLGVRPGIDLWIWLLALIGIFTYWNRMTSPVKLSLLAGLVICSIFPIAVVFALPAFGVLAAFGGDGLWKARWANPTLRDLTFMVIVCGVLLSLFLGIRMFSEAPPNEGIAQGMAVIPSSASVITDPQVMPWVKWWSPAIVSAYSMKTQDKIIERDQILSQLWYGRNLDDATRIMEGLGADTIVITPQMRTSIWTKPDQGVLFLINGETFRVLSNYSGVESYTHGGFGQ